MVRHVSHRRRALRAACGCLAAVLFPSALTAHEVRPAYLQLTEVSAGRFEVLWKQPLLPSGDPDLALRLPLEPRFPARCTVTGRVVPEVTESVLLERWVMTCADGGESSPFLVETLHGS